MRSARQRAPFLFYRERTMAGKANSIKLFSFGTPQMRAFHLTWVAFFVCFFAWFACAPLMPVIKGEFHLSACWKLVTTPLAFAGERLAWPW
jgi:hypothetical protein